MEKSNMAGALDRLGTIDAALKRKQTALRVLKQRIDTRHGSRPIPAEDAARIAILQREVASLERSRNAELLSLTSPSVRQQRLEKLDREVNWTSRSQSRAEDQTAPPAPPEASGASVAELRRRAESGLTSSGSLAPAPAPPHVPQTPQTQERRPPWKTGAKPTSPPLPPPPPPPPPPPNGEQHERESAANEVWLAYKEAQRLRDEELRVSMRGSWRTHSGELENLKQHAAPKVETGRERRRHSLSSADSAAGGASTYRIDGEGTPGLANGCASHAKAEPTPPSGLLRMTAAEALGPGLSQVTLLCTDIDTKVLQKAQRGVYDAECKGLSQDRLKRHFLKGTGRNDGSIRVKPELAKLPQFRVFNLMSPQWSGLGEAFDIVFCRNVMIYFDNETQRKVLEKIHAAMKPKGTLYVGHSENFTDCRDLFMLRGKTVYERV
jgi:chemotaxis protein methyltransferase CheR